MSVTFAQLGLPTPLVRALAQRDIIESFPVQAAAIPDALAGKDVAGKAPTGSGKTLAFGLPVLARVDKAESRRPRALILAPTRELAEQIKQELAPLAKSARRSVVAIYGGVGYGPQKRALREGADLLVATPGRLEDLIEQGSVDLARVDIVVVDEADRMADMGFLPAVRRILDQTSSHRQTHLFSATLDGDVAVLSRNYQSDPVRHEAGTVEPETIDARHHFWLVEHHERVEHTANLVERMGRSIVFTRTRRGADRVAKQLDKLGVRAVALHGGRSQNQRTRAVGAFSAGRAEALIATDVAARGIHIDAVASVIHFDPPGDSKDYLHRSGRTARAGAAGTVVSLVTADQRREVGRMQRDLDLQAPIEAPRLEVLDRGGYQIGEPRADKHNRPDSRPSRSPRGNPRHTKKSAESVYVANLPWTASARDVEALFGHHGTVHQATIITDKNGRSRGFAFVDMPGTDARTAIAALHGSKLDGRDLTVRSARPKSQSHGNRRRRVNRRR